MVTTCADPSAKEYVKKLISTLFDDVAALGDTIIDRNIGLMCENGASEEYRTISAETADYLMDNASLIYLGLLSNDAFRESMKNAVATEITLEEKSEEFVKDIRKDMQDGDKPVSERSYVIDLSRYDPETAEMVGNRIGGSIEKLAAYEDEFNELANELTEDGAMEIGFCVTNFAYLIRAFEHDPLFLNYIKDVLSTVSETLNI